MKTSARTLLTALGALALAATLGGCATAPGAAPGPAPTSGATGDSAPRAAWLDASALVLQTAGEGCAPSIADLSVGNQTIEVTLTRAVEGDCADGAPSTHGTYLGLPAGMDSSLPVTVEVRVDDGPVTEIEVPGLVDGELVPADRLPAHLPAVTWIGDGELAVLTWGSSTCVPRGGSVASGQGDTVSLSLDEPTDRPCTMDLVPRVTFVAAAGVPVFAPFTLTGYEGENGDPVVLSAPAVR